MAHSSLKEAVREISRLQVENQELREQLSQAQAAVKKSKKAEPVGQFDPDNKPENP